jgi:GT2 family glycosyltransferase
METSKFSEHQIFRQWFPDADVARQNSPFCNNANAAIRRALWEEHPYDEALSGLEDLAWARWAMDQGYHLAYVAEAEVIHVHNEPPRAVFNRYRREAMAYKRIFPEERFGLRDFVRLFTTNVLSDLWHALRQRTLLRNLGNILWFRYMQFWGTFQGYRQAGPLTWQLRQTFYYPRQLRPSGWSPPRDVEPIQYSEAMRERPDPDGV